MEEHIKPKALHTAMATSTPSSSEMKGSEVEIQPFRTPTTSGSIDDSGYFSTCSGPTSWKAKHKEIPLDQSALHIHYEMDEEERKNDELVTVLFPNEAFSIQQPVAETHLYDSHQVVKDLSDEVSTELKKESTNSNNENKMNYKKRPSHIGLSHVDILVLLQREGVEGLISLIFKMLHEKDLVTVCCVSSRWRDLVYNDGTANKRRRKYLQIRMENKENPAYKKKDQMLDEDSNSVRSVLGQVAVEINKAKPCNASVKQPVLPTRYEQFVQVAKTLPTNEILDKCPSCSSPARVAKPLKRGYCTKCNYYYCTKCRGAFHTPRDCSIVNPQQPQDMIRVQKAKKNLRRL